MRIVKCNYPASWEHANVYILSDLHIGDPKCNMDDVYRQIRQVKEDPYGLCVLNGDLVNTATRSSISDIYSETISPMEQLETVVSLFEPIKDRVIGATSGNHEDRIWNSDGVDIVRFMCKQLRIEDRYDPDAVVIFLRFGTKNGHDSHGHKNTTLVYSFYMTHGRGGGRKEGAKAIRLADMASIIDADIYIHSHTHLPMIMSNAFYRVHEVSKSVEKVDKLFVNSSGSLDYGGYSEKNEFKPAASRHPVIHLDGRNKLARATL